MKTVLLTFFGVSLLANVTHGRFSGTLTAGINPSGQCTGIALRPTDTELRISCTAASYECKANGNEIVNSHQACDSDAGRVDFFSYPHDTFKFCRKGFCSCMTTQYMGMRQYGNDKLVDFNFNDDHAWAC